MIKEIKEQLKTIGENVQYGICRKKDTWDCILIKKERIEKSGSSNLDSSFYLSVSVIREDEIPEEMVFDVEKKMKEIGFRRTSQPAKFDYTVDENEIIVEICKIEFVKPTKRCC